MKLSIFKQIFNLIDCQTTDTDDIPVYIVNADENECMEIASVQLKKQFNENGNEDNFVEIICSQSPKDWEDD